LPRSLLDGVDLGALRQAGGGGFAGLVAALVTGGAVQQDPDEPEWADRDRFVLGAPAAREAVRAAFAASPDHPDSGWVDAGEAGRALALAYGMAAASRLEGGTFTVHCLVDAAALDDGRTWEVLRSARASRVRVLRPYAVLPDDGADAFARMLRAAGWVVATADAGDVIEILGALDQARARREPPTAVVAVAS
jgi:transketolase N-terminal domain/subunit